MTRRRALLTGGGLLGIAAAGGAGYATGQAEADAGSGAADVVPFHGEHQAGIATPAQDRIVFGSFDLTIETAAELRDLLREWTRAAELMCAGRPTGTVAGHPELPPEDTGEAAGLAPAQLTITFGFGPDVFERDGKDRFGLRARRPSALKPLGDLPGDQLDPDRTGGDLCVQACSNDPQVAFHAVRNLARIAFGSATLRWTQLGFGRTSSTTRSQATPRNLMGFKDGTNNLRAEDTRGMDRFVWVGREEPQTWFRGGSYLVARRIRMFIETWDRDRLADQEAVFGRTKVSGAPLTGKAEFDEVDLDIKGSDGITVIPPDAHIRLASPAVNDGQHILRRGYSYTDGIDSRTGQLDAGLFFVAFQQDPHRQFVAIQRKLGVGDALMEYIQHTGSGLFAVPPGVRPGGFVGEGLFRG
ncbi:iron uptake transporter deferrochelatase/peroxidase subunit [Patulibacter sp.]|uniref:iron uptake transporter deferrochelatase/peroxidase subunit n=1 Tax=Patulibacter sp. TaxID=1912859 RepID=UPI002726D37F|nr:iron uptake transporter deferrochelatase/peroxidase subunit [Patulibacter sp.]MDO9410412.1 iron uptake transporter deferrochelatase/peroxidase subunit [Patulibacter sp.]